MSLIRRWVRALGLPTQPSPMPTLAPAAPAVALTPTSLPSEFPPVPAPPPDPERQRLIAVFEAFAGDDPRVTWEVYIDHLEHQVRHRRMQINDIETEILRLRSETYRP